MDLSLTWNPDDTVPVVVLLTTALACALFFTLGRARTTTPAALFRQRLAGLGLLGVLPLVSALVWLPGGPAAQGLVLSGVAVGAPAVLALLLLIGPILYVACRQPMQQARYPEIRVPLSQWDRALRLKSATTWAAYLLAYEWLFRGFLLMPLVEAWGLWPGMSVMVGLYVLAHLDKAPSEALSCFPMGVVFGLLSLTTGSIVWPWLLHVGIAVGSETACLHHARR